MYRWKKWEECTDAEKEERYWRQGDRIIALKEQVEALQKRIVSERSGRRAANRGRDEAVEKLKQANEFWKSINENFVGGD